MNPNDGAPRRRQSKVGGFLSLHEETIAPHHHTFGLSAAEIASLAIAAGGTYATVSGQKKQTDAINSANSSNQASVDDQNQREWGQYLLSRGIDPTGATTGQIPANPKAVNTKLPLWATVGMGGGNFNQKSFRLRGSAPTAAYTPPVTTAAAPAASSGSRIPSWLLGALA